MLDNLQREEIKTGVVLPKDAENISDGARKQRRRLKKSGGGNENINT